MKNRGVQKQKKISSLLFPFLRLNYEVDLCDNFLKRALIFMFRVIFFFFIMAGINNDDKSRINDDKKY